MVPIQSQGRRYVGPDLDSNCLQRLSPHDKNRGKQFKANNVRGGISRVAIKLNFRPYIRRYTSQKKILHMIIPIRMH